MVLSSSNTCKLWSTIPYYYNRLNFSVRAFSLVQYKGRLNKARDNSFYNTSSVYQTTIRRKMDYSKFLNEHAKRKKPSLIREMTKMMTAAGPGTTIFMAGGFPNPKMFPFESIDVHVEGNTKIHLEGDNIRAALQYQPSLGYTPLVTEMKKMILRSHNPPRWNEMDGIVTVGSQHGLSAVLEMILEPGDPILVPQPAYSSALSIMDPYVPKYLAVPEDALGMQPAALKSTLDNWVSSNNNEQRKKPKILYVNPTGTNPSGIVIPTDRKKEIYRLAQEYDFLILEDDPYFYLHFEEKDPDSFLSLDTDGRVIRLDSFSKILSSGIRVGYVTAPNQIIRALELSTQHSILHCSSLSQVIVQRILEQWGSAGFVAHTDKVKEFYRKRRDLTVAAAEKHLKGLAEWQVPQGGMFLWMYVPGLNDTYEMLMNHGIKQGVMLLPGREFMVDKSLPCKYVRASFSLASAEDIDTGFERLANLIRDQLNTQKPV